MAENPLLPHRRLQQLHALMLRCRELDRKNRSAQGFAREALLAAAAIQAEPGDLLCGEPGDSTTDVLAAEASTILKPAKAAKSTTSTIPAADKIGVGTHLLLCAGVAQGLQANGNKGVCLALASASGSASGWPEALAYAQAKRLPLVLLCADVASARRHRARTDALTEQAIMKLGKRLLLPVLSVDGDDAVAVYRVVQESLLRARHGDGPAVIWCSLESRKGGGKSQPIAHMERYLAVRGLKPLQARRHA